MEISVIFPARNEELLIKDAVEDVLKHLKGKKHKFEIIVVVNGSTDDTEKIVRGVAKKEKNVKLVKSKPGYGHALRKGLKLAKGRYIAIFNVDFYDFAMLKFAEIDLLDKDMIIGSKMTYWASDKRPLQRKLVSKLFNLYLKFVHGFEGSDTHGIKIMRKKLIDDVFPKCITNSGIFDSELVIKAQRSGFKIADYPVETVEKRETRFVKRITDTPRDIWELNKVMKD